MNNNNGTNGTSVPGEVLAATARNINGDIDGELDKMHTKITCALGETMTNDDKAQIGWFGEILRVLDQVKDLHGAVPFDTIARKRVELAGEGVFGTPTRKAWADRDRVEQNIATQHVYEVLFAAAAAGCQIAASSTTPEGADR